MTKVCAIVVIGHVDHGKTALVRALSGMETDRLEEERQRGLSIVPGFAYCQYADGFVDLIDAPGHSDFIGAMVAGAAGARAALLVVSLPDGIEAQTAEHVQIAQALGVGRFIVAMTKSDLVPPSDQSTHQADILAGLQALGITPLTSVICSVNTEDGLDTMHNALRALLSSAADLAPSPGAILSIDRVFAARGHGTVVTGTLIGGALGLKDQLTLFPGGRAITLRNIQSRGRDHDRVAPGQRVALNLRGVDRAEINRGALLAAPGQALATDRIDIHLDVLADARTGVKHMQELRVHFGTAAETARLMIYGERKLGAGENGFAQLRFTKPVAAYPKQAALLRGLSPAATLASARFLDPGATKARGGQAARRAVLDHARSANAQALAHALCHEGRGIADLSRFERLAGHAMDDPANRVFRKLAGGKFTAEATFQACRGAILDRVDRYFTENRLKTYMPESALNGQFSPRALVSYARDSLLEEGLIERRFNGLSRPEHNPEIGLDPDKAARMDFLEQLVRKAGIEPPVAKDIIETPLDDDLIALSLWSGRLVRLENVALRQMLLFHVDTLDTAQELLRGHFAPESKFTTSEARIVLQTTRKFIVPILEYFDQQGVTLRQGNLRWFNE
ncbi:MAG: selenocysteine-specific translation elongation factor [Arenibacterium sp.]